MEKITPRQISEAAGVTDAYSRMLLAGKRVPSLKVALLIYDATGAQLGPLAKLTKSQIGVARKMAA